ncbi:MAG: TrmH family RNA methyltransferase [Bdellovibrionales bacterium]
MKTITSQKNPQFRQWCDLLEGRGIKKHQRFLLSGRKTVPEVLFSARKRVDAVLVSGDAVELKVPAGVPVFNLTAPLFKELDESGTHSPLLVMHLPEIAEADLTQPPKGLEVICALGDPQNVGALIRVATAFEAAKVILLTESATPFHPKAVRSSSSTVIDMNFARGPSLKDLSDPLIAKHLVAFDQAGQDLRDYKWQADVRLLFGEEGPGLPSELRQNSVRIPISPRVESLNAVSAASIAMYAYRSHI